MRARAASLLALAFGISACGAPGSGLGDSGAGVASSAASEPPFPVRLTAEQVRGRAVYTDHCASCHGFDGRGDTMAAQGLPDSLPNLSAKRYGRLSVDALLARFDSAHGDGLRTVVTQRQTQAVLRYLPVLAYPADAPGSAVAGRRLYRRYCASCHGMNGNGAGPAASLLDTPPADFHVDTLVVARDFQALAQVTRDGPGHAHVSSMPAWGLFFNAQMLQDVSAYLPTFRTRRTATSPSAESPPG